MLIRWWVRYFELVVLSVVLVRFLCVLWVEMKYLSIVKFLWNEDVIGNLIILLDGVVINLCIFVNCVKLDVLLWVFELFIMKIGLVLLSDCINLFWIWSFVFV